MTKQALATTVGPIELAEHCLEIEGRTWRILHSGAIVSVEDEQRFLGAERRLPYGIVLWPAAIALAHELATRDLAGLRVLELGAGTGLPGIVAASRGARVVQTDNQPVALRVAKMNGERNGVGIEHREADWTAWKDDARYDRIVASDVLYGTTVHADLRRIFEANLAPGGALLIADPLRKMSFPLLEAMEADGWRVTMNKWSVSVRPPARAIGVFELTRD